MRLAFSETLSGGARPVGQSPGVQALSLELVATGRGIVECALGAPFAVSGSLRAESPTIPGAALVPERAIVTGTLRWLLSSGLFYDLRIGAGPDARPRDQLELRGSRRFVRGDLFASATTFDGELTLRGAKIGDVRLRFDARDDVPRLLRSLRVG